MKHLRHWVQSRSLREETVKQQEEREEFEIVFGGQEQEEGRKFLFIEMEFCEFLSLDKHLTPKNPSGGFSDSEIFLIFSQILEALIFIHSKGIVHLDLNPRNVLLKQNTVKLGDFGFAQTLESCKGISPVVGCGHYFAPELRCHSSPHINSDVFSLGVILYELVSRFRTYSERIQKLVRLSESQSLPKDDFPSSPFLYNLLNKMLQVNPEKRILSSEIPLDSDYLAWKKITFGGKL